MGKAVKLVVAAAALWVLASPSATSTVLGQSQHAFTAIRHEAAAEVATLRGTGTPVVTATAPTGPRSVTAPEAARPVRSRGSAANSYRFTVRDGRGRPARWNPCQPIPILVNLAHAPAGALTDLRVAVARLDAASGLRFYVAGTTSAGPSNSWGEQPWAGNPHGWPPVLVTFARPGTGPLGDDGSSGVTTPVWVDSGSHEVFVSALIVFNSAQNAMFRPGFGVGLHRGALFEHELGHLAGLDHVNDPRQVMYPEVGAVAGYGAGDLSGLRALGAGGCLAVPTPSWAG